MNDMYAKDISKKITLVKRDKQKKENLLEESHIMDTRCIPLRKIKL